MHRVPGGQRARHEVHDQVEHERGVAEVLYQPQHQRTLLVASDLGIEGERQWHLRDRGEIVG